MILQPQQTERFYRIWWMALSYTNAQLHVVPDLPREPAPGSIEPATAAKVRDALWANDSIRERFIAENPSGLAPADLEMVAGWKYRVSGNLFVFRHLKKYTIFLNDGSPPRVYGVLGLVSPLEEIVGPYLPVLVRAVLIPFEGQITYDSLLAPYRITFGGGIKRRLNAAYKEAQEREGIITTLLPPARPATADELRVEHRSRNVKLLREFQKEISRSGLSPKMVEQHVGNVQAFADDYLLSQDPPRPLLEMTASDVERYLTRVPLGAEGEDLSVSFKRFVRFLHDTDRMESDAVRAFQDMGLFRKERR